MLAPDLHVQHHDYEQAYSIYLARIHDGLRRLVAIRHSSKTAIERLLRINLTRLLIHLRHRLTVNLLLRRRCLRREAAVRSALKRGHMRRTRLRMRRLHRGCREGNWASGCGFDCRRHGRLSIFAPPVVLSENWETAAHSRAESGSAS